MYERSSLDLLGCGGFVRSRLFGRFMALVTLGLPLQAEAVGQPYLVKDINPTPNPFASSDPRNFVTIGTVTFFTAVTAGSPRGLWKTDGTTQGTTLVKAFSWSSLNPYTTGLTAAGNLLFFSAWDQSLGHDVLWRSDGTTDGTVIVGHEVPTDSTAMNGMLFFRVPSGESGSELWRSDGTEAGTLLVKRLGPSSVISMPSPLVEIDGTLLFTNGSELWKSDGTEAGTVVAQDIAEGPLAVPGSPEDVTMATVNGILFFATEDPGHGAALWRSDGTAAGTRIVKRISTAANMATVGGFVNVNGVLFFRASAAGQSELWKSDGTETGTVLVKNVWAGYPTAVGSTLFFVSNDGTTGGELWKSDGTEAGTQLVKDIAPGSASSEPSYLTNFNGILFFSVSDPDGGTSYGLGLWRSDGTEAGTFHVKDVYGSQLTVANGVLLFSGNDGRIGSELWRSDGTEAGTVLVMDINVASLLSSPTDFVDVNGALFFFANDGAGRGLWRSDGTRSGTYRVKNIWPASYTPGPSTSPMKGIASAGRLFFIPSDAAHGTNPAILNPQVWVSDGTEAGTIALTAFESDSAGARLPMFLRALADKVLFMVSITGAETHYELWKTDGTASGTALVTSIPPLRWMISTGQRLLFAASDGKQLWVSDGTAAGTIPLTELPSPAGPWGVLDGMAFLTTGSELWRTDGTTAGTFLLKADGPHIPSVGAAVDHTLFFTGTDVGGSGLWKTDGTPGGTALVTRIQTRAGFPPMLLPSLPGRLFLYVITDAGRELQTSDGTQPGTVFVSSLPDDLVWTMRVRGDALYFLVSDSMGLTTLWKSDGTVAGTAPIETVDHFDGRLTVAGNSAAGFVGSKLLYAAYDTSVGQELWAIDLSESASGCAGDCDGNGAVTVDELLTGVNIALGNAAVGTCSIFDSDHSGNVTVDELLTAVSNALNGCRP